MMIRSFPRRYLSISAVVIGILLLFAADFMPVRAATFEDGIAAQKAGDYSKAAAIWERLARQGHAGAQVKLADTYYKGLHRKQDFVRALAWYRKAAGQNHPEAQYMLGQMYTYGHGVKADYDEALKWFRRAAAQGHADAQYSIGASYFKGFGVETDYVTAYAWMTLAMKNGSTLAGQKRELLAGVLSKSQKRKAGKLAAKLARQYPKKK